LLSDSFQFDTVLHATANVDRISGFSAATTRSR